MCVRHLEDTSVSSDALPWRRSNAEGDSDHSSEVNTVLRPSYVAAVDVADTIIEAGSSRSAGYLNQAELLANVYPGTVDSTVSEEGALMGGLKYGLRSMQEMDPVVHKKRAIVVKPTDPVRLLPNDILIMIFSLLDTAELLSISMVSLVWMDAVAHLSDVLRKSQFSWSVTSRQFFCFLRLCQCADIRTVKNLQFFQLPSDPGRVLGDFDNTILRVDNLVLELDSEGCFLCSIVNHPGVKRVLSTATKLRLCFHCIRSISSLKQTLGYCTDVQELSLTADCIEAIDVPSDLNGVNVFPNLTSLDLQVNDVGKDCLGYVISTNSFPKLVRLSIVGYAGDYLVLQSLFTPTLKAASFSDLQGGSCGDLFKVFLRTPVRLAYLAIEDVGNEVVGTESELEADLPFLSKLQNLKVSKTSFTLSDYLNILQSTKGNLIEESLDSPPDDSPEVNISYFTRRNCFTMSNLAPNLTVLRLLGFSWGDRCCSSLKYGLLDSLVELDFSHSYVTDQGIKLLFNEWDCLPNLKLLRIVNTAVSSECVKWLKSKNYGFNIDWGYWGRGDH